jgi:hypothetical protein
MAAPLRGSRRCLRQRRGGSPAGVASTAADEVQRAARENPGRRIAVLVGVEHGCRRREQPRAAPGVIPLE